MVSAVNDFPPQPMHNPLKQHSQKFGMVHALPYGCTAIER
jgi:hypothetical protein